MISFALVLLVSGLGTDAEVFRIPETGGLADALARADHEVVTLPPQRGTLAERADEIAAAARGAKGAPVYVVGLDLGGTAALLAARSTPAIRRVVLVGSPIAFGGGSRAAKILFAQPHDTDWEAVGALGLQGPLVRRGLVELLLTHGLPARIHAPLRARALAPMTAATLAELRGLDQGAVPEPHAALAVLAADPALEALVVVAMADGLFPPWQCDPAAFGLRRENVTRRYFTRANDSAREYGHLDLLLHPAGLGEVHPAILDWLARE